MFISNYLTTVKAAVDTALHLSAKNRGIVSMMMIAAIMMKKPTTRKTENAKKAQGTKPTVSIEEGATSPFWCCFLRAADHLSSCLFYKRTGRSCDAHARTHRHEYSAYRTLQSRTNA